MVKKLIKHEFMALTRLLAPMYIILLGLSVITRILFIFENDSVVFGIIAGSSVAVLGIGLVVGVVYTVVSCIIRFYRNLFSKEGYLSFTLPVSVEAHLLTKAFTAVVAYFASIAVVIIAFCIATSGDLFVELVKAAIFILGKASEVLGANLPFYFIEAALYLIVGSFSGMFLFYACMCIGQLAKRSRVLLALGVYFGYYYLVQIIVTVLMIGFTTFQYTEAFQGIMDWIGQNAELFVHLLLIGGIVLYAIMGGVYYLIAHTIMKKKLNLE